MQEAEAALDPEDDRCHHPALCGMGDTALGGTQKSPQIHLKTHKA